MFDAEEIIGKIQSLDFNYRMLGNWGASSDEEGTYTDIASGLYYEGKNFEFQNLLETEIEKEKKAVKEIIGLVNDLAAKNQEYKEAFKGNKQALEHLRRLGKSGEFCDWLTDKKVIDFIIRKNKAFIAETRKNHNLGAFNTFRIIDMFACLCPEHTELLRGCCDDNEKIKSFEIKKEIDSKIKRDNANEQHKIKNETKQEIVKRWLEKKGSGISRRQFVNNNYKKWKSSNIKGLPSEDTIYRVWLRGL